MRNPNGYGTIRKLPGNRRKPWAIIITSEYDPNTRTVLKRKYVSYHATKGEAIRALAEYNRKKELYKDTKATFSEIYNEYITRDFVELSKKGSEAYITGFKNLKQLHNRPIKDITTQEIQDIFDSYAGKSGSFYNQMKITCNKVFEWAINNCLLEKNPVKAVKIRVSKKATTRATKALTIKQIALIVEPWNNFNLQEYSEQNNTIVKTHQRETGEIYSYMADNKENTKPPELLTQYASYFYNEIAIELDAGNRHTALFNQFYQNVLKKFQKKFTAKNYNKETEREKGYLLTQGASIIIIMLFTGCRISEVIGLTIDRVDTAKREIIIEPENEKTGKERHIPIAKYILPTLNTYKEQAKQAGETLLFYKAAPKKYLNIVNQKILKEFIGTTSHALRKTTTTLLQEMRVPVAFIDKLTGHAGAGMTNTVYTQLDHTTALKYIDELKPYIDKRVIELYGTELVKDAYNVHYILFQLAMLTNNNNVNELTKLLAPGLADSPEIIELQNIIKNLNST